MVTYHWWVTYGVENDQGFRFPNVVHVLIIIPSTKFEMADSYQIPGNYTAMPTQVLNHVNPVVSIATSCVALSTWLYLAAKHHEFSKTKRTHHKLVSRGCNWFKVNDASLSGKLHTASILRWQDKECSFNQIDIGHKTERNWYFERLWLLRDELR